MSPVHASYLYTLVIGVREIAAFLAILGAVFVLGRAFYNVLLHPLSKIPGPKLCAATDVRSYHPPPLLQSINHPLLKSAQNTLQGFSAKALLEQEDIVQGYVDKLIGQINVYATGPEGDEMVKWYNFFTFDLIGDLAFGESFASLNDAKPHFWVSLLLGNIKAVAWWSVARWFHLFQILGVWTAPKSAMEMRINHSEYSRKMIIQRMNTKSTRRDLLSGQFGADGPGMTIPELSGQASTIITAGSETTAIFLSGTTYHLLKIPRVYRLLVEEIRSAYNTYEEIADTNATKLRYLSAVIDEGLRIYPRRDRHVKLSASPWSTCRSPENFHDPEEFKPERWLDPHCTDKKHARQPFSLGSRPCIDRSLALKEIRPVLSKVFWAYDMELVNKDVDLNRDSTSFVLG
ncbi:putative cytochrome P450 [Tuber brumale]|nr:putative cytochrome P450 [Tuber brumale]